MKENYCLQLQVSRIIPWREEVFLIQQSSEELKIWQNVDWETQELNPAGPNWVAAPSVPDRGGANIPQTKMIKIICRLSGTCQWQFYSFSSHLNFESIFAPKLMMLRMAATSRVTSAVFCYSHVTSVAHCQNLSNLSRSPQHTSRCVKFKEKCRNIQRRQTLQSDTMSEQEEHEECL